MKKMTKRKLKSLVKKSIPLELMLVATLGASGCAQSDAMYGDVAVIDDQPQKETHPLPLYGTPLPPKDYK